MSNELASSSVKRGNSRAYIFGGIAIAVLLVIVMGILFLYIRSLQDPGRAMPAQASDQAATAAELNKQSREAGFPKILFTSRNYSSGQVNDVDAKLGPVESEEVVRYFRFLHNAVVSQKEQHNIRWNGGLHATVKGVDVYLDADISPTLVGELAKVNDTAFTRLTLTEGATSATTRDCSSLVGDQKGYRGCTERVQTGIERLLRKMPAESKQHNEVYLLIGESAGRYNQGIIQIKQRTTEELDSERIATSAGALARLYLEAKALPEVKRVEIDPIQPLTPEPKVTVTFTAGVSNSVVCVLPQTLESKRTVNSKIAQINEELDLNFALASDC